MKLTHQLWLRRGLIIGLLVIALTTVSGRAYAQDTLYGDSVGPSDTVDNDIILTGDNIDVDGAVTGDVLAIGRHVTVDGSITGSLVVLADTITISGEIGGTIYAIASSLELTPEAAITGNVNFLGVRFTSRAGSTITRDLNAVVLGINLNGAVGRTTNVTSGLIEIVPIIMDRLSKSTTGRSLTDVPAVAALFQQEPLASTTGGAMFSYLAQNDAVDGEDAASDGAADAAVWLIDQLRILITYLVIGLLAIWLLPNRMDRWAQRLELRPLVAGGAGFVVFIVGFVGAIILLVLIIALVAGMFFLTLSELALVTLGLSLSGFAFAFSIFMLFVSYLSKIIVAYLVGRLILGRLFPRGLNYRIWPLLLGLVLFTVLNAIPIFGWLVSLLITFLGLGAVWLAFNDRFRLAAAPEPAGA